MTKTLLIVFGPPGSGKSTALGFAQKQFEEFKYISTGDLARNEKDNRTTLGLEIARHEVLKLNFPPKLLGNIVLDEINNSTSKIIALDSYPKNIEELEYLIENIVSSITVTKLIFENEDKHELRNRMGLRGREGETFSQIDSRISFYENNIKPLIDNPILTNKETIKINTERGIKEVCMRVAQMVEQLVVCQ